MSTVLLTTGTNAVVETCRWLARFLSICRAGNGSANYLFI